jgi:hypothetical protein
MEEEELMIPPAEKPLYCPHCATRIKKGGIMCEVCWTPLPAALRRVPDEEIVKRYAALRRRDQFVSALAEVLFEQEQPSARLILEAKDYGMGGEEPWRHAAWWWRAGLLSGERWTRDAAALTGEDPRQHALALFNEPTVEQGKE